MTLAAGELATTHVTAIGSLAKQTRDLASYAWMATGVCIGVTALAVPRFGFAGCAYASFAANLVLPPVYLRKSQELTPVTYQWKRGLMLAGLTFLGCLASRWLPTGPLPTSLARKRGLCLAFAIALGMMARVRWPGVKSLPT